MAIVKQIKATNNATPYDIGCDWSNIDSLPYNFENLDEDRIKANTLHLGEINGEGGKIVFGNTDGDVEPHDAHFACIEEIGNDELNFKAANFNFEIDVNNGGGQFRVTGGPIIIDAEHYIEGNLLGNADSATYAESAGYADSAGTAEVATTADCLADKSKGSATQPVYINASGRPVACSYSLSKSVPSNAVFTDTKNTAGTTTAISTKLFLVGGAEVASSTQTYTNSNCYIGTDNCLYSGGKKVSTTDTKNTVGAATTTSKLYFIGTTTSTSADSQQSYKNVSVCVSGTALYAAGGFYESSDERLKDFSNKIDADLDKISKIKKHKFTWKDSENKNEEIGVSAQEIRELYPEIVSENEEGYLSVAYDKLAVVALAAIDELHKKNKELEARIELLESKLLN